MPLTDERRAAGLRRAARRPRPRRAWASASGFAHPDVPPALLEAADARALPARRDPVRDAVHRRHREGLLAAGQRAVRAAAAGDRRAGPPPAHRARRARARRHRLGAELAARRDGRSCFDARGELRERHDFRRGLTDELRRRRSAPRCANAAGATSRAASPRPARRPRAPRRAGAAAAPPQAWLVAAKDAGGLTELDRVVLHQAVTVVALELLRRHVAESDRAPPGRRRARRAGLGRARPARSSRGGSTPFGLGGKVTALVAAVDAEHALRGGDRCRGRRPRLSRPPAELSCALLPGFGDDELVDLAARVARRAGVAGRRRRARCPWARRAARCSRRAARSRRGR